MRFELSEAAQQDVDAILDWSSEKFGEQAQARYAWLLEIVFAKIGADQEMSGSREFHDVRLYHLRHSKKDAELKGGIVKRPRHFVVYRVGSDRNLMSRLTRVCR